MAVALIHSQDDFTSSSPSVWHSSFGTVDIPAGSLIIAIVSESTNSAGGGTLTDDAGNTYTALITKNPNNATASGFVRVWYCNNCLHLTTAANNFVYTPAGGAGVAVSARWMALSGASLGTNPFDAAVTASAVGSTGIPQVTSGTPGRAGEYMIGIVETDNTPGTIGFLLSPYTNNQDALGSTQMLDLGDFINSGTGTGLVKTGGSNTKPWAAIAIGAKAATAPLLGTAGSYSITGSSALLVRDLITATSIGSGGSTATASVTITIPAGGVPAGSLIVVALANDNPNFVPTCTDTAGNTYHRISDTSSWNQSLFYAYNCLALVSGNTISISTGATASLHTWSAAYFTQIQTASDPYDSAVHAAGSGSSAVPTVTSGTPSVAGELFIAQCVQHGGSTTITQDTGHGWAAPPNAANNPGNPAGMYGNQVNAGTGTKIYAPTLAVSDSWDAIVYGFKARPQLNFDVLLGAAGSYTITGFAASLTAGRDAHDAPGSYSITGASAKLVYDHPLLASPGSYTITGASAFLDLPAGLDAAGSYTITGQPALLKRSYPSLESAGSYTITGQPASLLHNYVLGDTAARIDGTANNHVGTGVSASSVAATLTTTNAAGDMIAVYVATVSSVGLKSVSSVTAPGLSFTRRGVVNSWTASVSGAPYFMQLELWYAFTTSAVTKTITANLGSAVTGAQSDIAMVAFGIAGVDSASPFNIAEQSGQVPASTAGGPTYTTTSGPTMAIMAGAPAPPSGVDNATGVDFSILGGFGGLNVYSVINPAAVTSSTNLQSSNANLNTWEYLADAVNLTADAVYRITGAPATLVRVVANDGTSDAGSYTITGDSAALVRGLMLKASPGSYSITGDSALFEYDHTLDGSAGTYAITGQPAVLARSYLYGVDAGSYDISGADAMLLHERIIAAAAGHYTLTGDDVALLRTRLFPLDAGSYDISGSDAILIVQSPNDPGASQTGHYSISGHPATLVVGHKGNKHRLKPGDSGINKPWATRDPPINQAEIDFSRQRVYARGVDAMVPPPLIANHNLTTRHSPIPRPVVDRRPRGK